jgi:long-chain acyl-CoA synthetase
VHTFTLDKPDNLIEWWKDSVDKYTYRKFIGTKNTNGVYEWVTRKEVNTRIDNLRAGLARIDVHEGDAVGIIANNCVEWILAAFATWGLLARYVPMYEMELVQVWKHILVDSEVKVLFVSNARIYERIKDFKDTVPTLKHIVIIKAEGRNSMTALEKTGSAHPVSPRIPKPHDIAEIIYTSGTTGKPKGVLLSHGNFTSNALAGIKVYPELQTTEITTMTILPWTHTFGQTAELFAVIHLGGAMGLAQTPSTIAKDIIDLKPTHLIAVPGVFNRIHTGLLKKINEKGGLAKSLFLMGVEAANQRRKLAAEGRSCFIANLKFNLADTIVFRKIRKRLGGRLQGAMSGGATMNLQVAQFFFDIGIRILDCYGLTETSPAVAMNAYSNYRLGSAGKAIDKIKIVIDSSSVEQGATDGEIIVYGPNVMKGYHNRPEDTRATMTTDGGFRTGDRGRLDKDGFLFITGRIKDQYKLVNGKFCFPAGIEEEICLTPVVQQAVIYGCNRPFNICIVVPDFDVLQNHARKKGLPTDIKALVAHQDSVDFIGETITNHLKGKFAKYAIPKKFLLLAEPFSLNNGMLTQTMKIKRDIVLNKFIDRIEALYK